MRRPGAEALACSAGRHDQGEPLNPPRLDGIVDGAIGAAKMLKSTTTITTLALASNNIKDAGRLRWPGCSR